MKKSNYAFVSALYASKTKGLYSDIYFPIIKYALAKKFAAKNSGNVYCSADEVSEFIDEKFGIKIPTIVIAKSVHKIGNGQNRNFNLVVYEKGNTFLINKAVFDEDEIDIEEKERFFSDKLEEIEHRYQDFLIQQGCVDDGVSFIQFIADNTDEVLGYFEDGNRNCVDEKYATLVNFLQFVHEADKNLYAVVHQLFWSSIVVAFLKSEKPLVDDSSNGIKAEYYLDTSIVLGLLDLSTPFKEAYSKEVCSIILNSGGLLRVNPMTVEEIRYILEKVEQNGPNPLTDIADAYSRRNLIPNKLAKIRLNLESYLLAKQIDILPKMSPDAIQRAVNDYKGKGVTKLLKDFRSKTPSSYSNDNFREIHDVYMDDFIKKRRKEKDTEDGINFLTDNVDLVKFCHSRHDGTNYMLSTGKVVLDLWMHNNQKIDVSDCVLTETMARCLGIHKSNVRYKIAEVARFYNQTKDDFDPQVYKDFIAHLYRRAKNAIVAAEQIKADGVLPQSIANLIKEAVDKDNEAYNNSLAQAEKTKQNLQKESELKEKRIEEIKNDVADLKGKVEHSNNKISALKSDKDALAVALQQHKADLKQTNEALEQARQRQEKADRKIVLYQEKEQLVKKVKDIKDELVPLQRERVNAFKNWSPKVFALLGGILLICGAMLTYAFFANGKEGWCVTYAEISIAAGLTLFGWKHTLDNSEEKRAGNVYAKWEARNPRYSQLTENLDKTNERLKEINAELNHELYK